MPDGQAANTKPASKRARRPGARRRWLGWTASLAAAVVVALWVVSVWWWFGISVGRAAVGISGGAVVFEWHEQVERMPFVSGGKAVDAPIWWTLGGPPMSPQASFNIGVFAIQPVTITRIYVATLVWVLLWPIALLTTLTGAGLLISARRARRRAITNQCSACGYDLIGLPANAPCPECGPKA